MVPKPILDPLKGNPPCYPHTKPINVEHEGVYFEKPKTHIVPLESVNQLNITAYFKFNAKFCFVKS